MEYVTIECEAADVWKKLNIKFVIDGGNLLEYTRGKMIQRDNDIDIRFDINDFQKWKKCR